MKFSGGKGIKASGGGGGGKVTFKGGGKWAGQMKGAGAMHMGHTHMPGKFGASHKSHGHIIGLRKQGGGGSFGVKAGGRLGSSHKSHGHLMRLQTGGMLSSGHSGHSHVTKLIKGGNAYTLGYILFMLHYN